MSLPVFSALPGQGFATKSPVTASVVADHPSGRSVRTSLYGGLYEFEVGFEGLAADSGQNPGLAAQSLQSILGLYLQCGGGLGAFLYTDPNDDRVTNQFLATGDGATTQFKFLRSMGAATDVVGYVTSISAVTLNGVAATGWTLDAPNVLSFSSPPAADAIISASFGYAFVCRFLDDSVEFETFMQNLWSTKSVKFRSVRQ